MLEQNQFILDNFDQIVAGIAVNQLQEILIGSIENSKTKFSIECSMKEGRPIEEFERYVRAYLAAPYGGKYCIIDTIDLLGVKPNSHQYWSLIIKQLLFDSFCGRRPCSGSFNKIATVAQELNLHKTKPYVDIQSIDQLISFGDALESKSDRDLETEIKARVVQIECDLEVLCNWTVAKFKKLIPECGFMHFEKRINGDDKFDEEGYLNDCATNGKRLRQISDYTFNRSARLIYPITDKVSLRLFPVIDKRKPFYSLAVEKQDGIQIELLKDEGYMNGNDTYFKVDTIYTTIDNNIKIQLIDAIALAKTGKEPIKREEL